MKWLSKLPPRLSRCCTFFVIIVHHYTCFVLLLFFLTLLQCNRAFKVWYAMINYCFPSNLLLSLSVKEF